MSLLKTPICEFGKESINFSLFSTDNIKTDLKSVKGPSGTLIMFICNHCPYVKTVIHELVKTTEKAKLMGFNSVAIMPNDYVKYPEDNLENMTLFSKKNKFNFPYLLDKNQKVAKLYGAVCTPDFFCYNAKDELQYRGRIRGLKDLLPEENSENELLKAITLISKTGTGPEKQFPSMGCSIKWKD